MLKVVFRDYLKIIFSKKDSVLMAQGTGQPVMPLEATDKDIFKFEQAGAVFEFNPIDKKMILKQGGQAFNFSKE